MPLPSPLAPPPPPPHPHTPNCSGPGCSSVGIGFLQEMGPFMFDNRRNVSRPVLARNPLRCEGLVGLAAPSNCCTW